MGILQHYFSSTDLTDIKEAVQEAEKKTSGEIVPFFAEASHHYREWTWLGAFIGGGLGGLTLLALDIGEYRSWDFSSLDSIAFIWLGAIAGFFITYFISKIRLMIVPYGSKAFFVNLEAKEAFLEEEVFRTGSRTGILIYISLFERIVRVLPDTGIANIVPQSDWDEAVQLIVKGMKSGKRKDGIVESILFCGNLLVKYGIKVQKDDKNEISDEIRDGGTQL
jgi:putative membrane protein